MKTMFWSTLIYAGVLVAAYNHASFAGNVLAVVCTAGYLYVLGSTLREWLEYRRHLAEGLELEELDWAEEWEETKQLMREAEERKNRGGA
jgi:hypothetical protein